MSEAAAVFTGQVPKGDPRDVYIFDVPEGYQSELVKKEVGLVKLRGGEEAEATRRAEGDSIRLAFELVKQSVWSVDGKQIQRHNAEDEKVWNDMDPRLRGLLLSAYGELHTPTEKVTSNFLKGMRTTVG
jgi:hypothetical protein